VHGAGAGRALGRAQFEAAAEFVQRAVTRVDVDTRADIVEVGAGPLQASELTPAQAGVGGGDDQQPGVGGHARGDDDDLVGSGVGALGTFGEGDAQLATWVGADESFVDGFAEDHGEQHQDVLAALVAERAAELVVHPALDCDASDVAHGGAGPAGQDVVADVGVVGRAGRGGDVVGLRPVADPFVDRGLGQAGVDEAAAALVGFDVGGAVVGGIAGGEAVLGDQGAVGESVADAVAAPA
jgi:hypothetical protein